MVYSVLFWHTNNDGYDTVYYSDRIDKPLINELNRISGVSDSIMFAPDICGAAVIGAFSEEYDGRTFTGRHFFVFTDESREQLLKHSEMLLEVKHNRGFVTTNQLYDEACQRPNEFSCTSTDELRERLDIFDKASTGVQLLSHMNHSTAMKVLRWIKGTSKDKNLYVVRKNKAAYKDDMTPIREIIALLKKDDLPPCGFFTICSKDMSTSPFVKIYVSNGIDRRKREDHHHGVYDEESQYITPIEPSQDEALLLESIPKMYSYGDRVKLLLKSCFWRILETKSLLSDFLIIRNHINEVAVKRLGFNPSDDRDRLDIARAYVCVIRFYLVKIDEDEPLRRKQRGISQIVRPKGRGFRPGENKERAIIDYASVISSKMNDNKELLLELYELPSRSHGDDNIGLIESLWMRIYIFMELCGRPLPQKIDPSKKKVMKENINKLESHSNPEYKERIRKNKKRILDNCVFKPSEEDIAMRRATRTLRFTYALGILCIIMLVYLSFYAGQRVQQNRQVEAVGNEAAIVESMYLAHLELNNITVEAKNEMAAIRDEVSDMLSEISATHDAIVEAQGEFFQTLEELMAASPMPEDYNMHDHNPYFNPEAQQE